MNEKEYYETTMNYIAKMYRDVKNEIKEVKEENGDYIYDGNDEFVKHIDTILSLFPEEYERIIRNDYLEERTVKWWQQYYKKSTYYRRKYKAVSAFVDVNRN